MNDPYERLAAALDALPNGFPRTPGGKEIQILRKIFSPEEAFLASQLSREMELPTSIAARAGIPADQAATRLKASPSEVWFGWSWIGRADPGGSGLPPSLWVYTKPPWS